MNGISGYMGYPNQFQVTANPTGAALTQLNADFSRDFGLGMPQTYSLPINVAAGYGGYDPTGMGMGMGMMGPYGFYNQQYMNYLNMDYKDRLQYDADLRNEAREIQYNEGKSSKNYACATDGLTGSFREACNTLQTAIIEGESDQIVAKFEGLVDMLRRSPLYARMQEEYKDDPVSLDKALRNAAREQFQAATGQDMTAMIQQNCDGAIANSFWNVVSFGNNQRHSAEETIARLNGVEVPKTVKTRETFGKIGGTTAFTAAGAAIGFVFGGPIIGAAIGLGIGLFNSFKQK